MTSSQARFLEGMAWMIGLQLLYGTLMLGWATIRLRPYESEARPWGLRMFGSSRSVQPRRLMKRRACGDEPMIWKECTGTLSVDGPIKAVMFLLLVVAAVGGLGYLFWELGVPSFQEMREYGTGGEGTWVARKYLNFSIRTITAIIYVLTGLMLGASAATGITMEHEKDTWISLVSTPLDGVEIVKAKVLGAFWRVRTPLAALVSVWVMGMCCGAVHPIGVIAAAVATAIYAVFFAILGTYVSLRFKSSARAIATTIAVLVFLNGGYLFCCLPLIEGTDVVIVLAGFTPMIVTYAPFSARELESFFSVSHPGSIDFRGQRDRDGLPQLRIVCIGGVRALARLPAPVRTGRRPAPAASTSLPGLCGSQGNHIRGRRQPGSVDGPAATILPALHPVLDSPR